MAKIQKEKLPMTKLFQHPLTMLEEGEGSLRSFVKHYLNNSTFVVNMCSHWPSGNRLDVCCGR